MKGKKSPILKYYPSVISNIMIARICVSAKMPQLL